MPDDFHFIRIVSSGEPLWQVREGNPAGRFLGTVTELSDGFFQASLVVAGALQTERFPDRDAAARWRASIAPKQGR